MILPEMYLAIKNSDTIKAGKFLPGSMITAICSLVLNFLYQRQPLFILISWLWMPVYYYSSFEGRYKTDQNELSHVHIAGRIKSNEYFTNFVFATYREIGVRVKVVIIMLIKYEQIFINYIPFFSVLAVLSNSAWQSMLLVDYKKIITENRPFSWKMSIFSNFASWGGSSRYKNVWKYFWNSVKPILKGTFWWVNHIKNPIFMVSYHPNGGVL